LLTRRPADILKLGAGRLARGLPGDLTVIDLETPWQIDTLAFRSKSKNSPFDGYPVQGRVLQTVVDGRTIFRAD
jgi:dihydroorotase